ncbi:hypothetical protein LXA43DRAFT_1004628 [Ganoderma leucocontextum]|nr:hypothetical protein LXA43DRAFT_1004628 [Ganoderma leucocontextum]
MSSPGRSAVHRPRTDTNFLIEASPIASSSQQLYRTRENDQISRSYPGSSSMSTPRMGTPPSPNLQPERPPRSQSPDPWTLSSPPSEMPSPLRKALVPMLNLAREAKEEVYADRNSWEPQVRPAAPAPTDDRERDRVDVPLSRRSSSKPRSSPASPPTMRAQGYRTYHSPRVETDSEGEDNSNSMSHSAWRASAVERVVLEMDEPRSPPVHGFSPRGSPRRSAKNHFNKVKRTSVAQRRMMDMSALSSDSGLAPSPLCHSPLVSLPLPDIPQSASDVERLFFPPQPPRMSTQRASQRTTMSPIPSPSQSPLALQPPLPLDREGEGRRPQSAPEDNSYRPPSRGSSGGRMSPAAMSAPAPLSPGSTLAQTRPSSPAVDRASAKERHAGSSKQFERTPSPEDEPALRHSTFYMEDELVILRVENTLFRIHRYFLERDSTYFKDFFQRELVHGAGKTDRAAIILPDVSKREFECLLHFLYHGASSPQYDSILNLVLLLSTASHLSFPAARTHAIAALDAASPPLDPVERVFLAEKYGIPTWRRPAYVELCGRAHPLEDAEAEVLGLQTTARLARAREAVLEEKVAEWRRAVERAESGQGVSKDDMQVREAKLVERVVDEIFAVDR